MALCLCSCTEKGVDSYLNWYENYPPAVISLGQRKISAKEYPRELGWVAFYGKSKLTGEFLDSLESIKEQHYQWLINIEDTTVAPASAAVPAFGRYTFHIGNLSPLDARPLSTGGKNEKYLVVFRQQDVDVNRSLTIAGPDGSVAEIPVSSILIKEKRKLRI